MSGNKKGESGPKPPFGIRHASNKVPTEAPGDDLFNNCLQEKTQHSIVEYLFQPEQFQVYWEKSKRQPDRLRALRVMVQIGTIHACLKGKYYLPSGESVALNKKTNGTSCKSNKNVSI